MLDRMVTALAVGFTAMRKPKTNLLDHVSNEQEFKRSLDTIAHDLGRVLDKWRLFKELGDAHKTHWIAIAQAQSFWSTTMGALQDAAVFGLCRAYDDHRDALSLRSITEALLARPAFLAHLVPIAEAVLVANLAAIDRRRASDVSRLLTWRDNFYAHRSALKIVERRSLGEQAQITFDEMDQMFTKAFSIVNGYSRDLFRSTHAPAMVGADDYLNMLNFVQEAVEHRRRRAEESAGR